MNLLSEGGKQSSMRAAFLLVTVPVAMILLSLAVVVLSSLWTKEAVDYSGIALLVGALAAPVTGAGAVKAYQKQYEEPFQGID